jgi:hypothetical protein
MAFMRGDMQATYPKGRLGTNPATRSFVAQDQLIVERRERRKAGAFRLPVSILPQPDETTCGPTCLHAVFRYWGDDEPLAELIARSHRFEHGGTLAVFLACEALRKGYRATIYTYNITVFDPTWFTGAVDIAERLEQQRRLKPDDRLQQATAGYLEFLRLGGELCLAELSVALVHGMLLQRLPVITGLSATYLYGSARELDNGTADDVAGTPAGHFVVLSGFNSERRTFLVADPYQRTPYEPPHAYWIGVERVMASILLGIVTHDANLLVVHPKRVQAPVATTRPIEHFEPL